MWRDSPAVSAGSGPVPALNPGRCQLHAECMHQAGSSPHVGQRGLPFLPTHPVEWMGLHDPVSAPVPSLLELSMFRLRVLALGRKHNYSYHSAPLQHSPLFLSVAQPGLGVLLCGSWTSSLSRRARSALGRSRFHGHHPFHWNFQLNHEGQELARSPPTHPIHTPAHIPLYTPRCLFI